MKGKFYENLRRSFRQIKSDRALSIAEEAEMVYKRRVEDLERRIKTTRRNRINALDLSPATTTQVTFATNFDANKFVQEDIDYGIELRNLEIQLEIARESYKNLFE
jgi:hypothetical protein